MPRNAVLLALLAMLIGGCGSQDFQERLYLPSNWVNPNASPDIFYLNYRLPQRPYYEIGVFTFAVPQGQGNADNYLTKELKQKGLDGAIILERENEAWDFERGGGYYSKLTYLGIIYADHLKGSVWLEQIDIEMKAADQVLFKTRINLDFAGQITDTTGDPGLYLLATAIQPWYFLNQQAPRFSHFGNNLWPRVIEKISFGEEREWFFLEQADTLQYRYWSQNLKTWRLKMVKLHEQWVLAEVIYNGNQDTVESIFEDQRLVQQIWRRPQYNQQIIYSYTYTPLDEFSAFKLVSPKHLQD